MMKQVVKYFFTKSGYFYLWKSLELLTIIIAAHFLMINEFSIAFFPIILAYFFMSFFDVSMKETDAKKVKRFCNTLSLVSPLYGIFSAVMILAISFIYPLMVPLRFAAAIVLFMSFKKTAEVFYLSRKRHEKVYFVNLISQVISSILLFVLLFFDFKGLSILISYLVFHIFSTIMLWVFFPFKIRSSLDKKSYREIFLSIRENLKINIPRILTIYSPLIVVGFFNQIYFSYIFLAFTIGYFLYENMTIFVTDLFLERFVNMSYDMFKYNLVKITEYLSFIVLPISMINIVLIPQISSIIVNWEGFAEILLMLIIAGMIKSITDITRIIFITEPNEIAMIRIGIIELVMLFFFIIVLGLIFGSYGIAMAMLISVIIISVIKMLVAQRFIKLDVITVSRNFIYIFFSALIAALSVGLLKEWFNIQNIYSVFFIYIFGLLFYLLLTFLINRDLYKSFIRFIFEVLEE